MPQPPDWKHVLEIGMNFTEVRREQAHRIASDLVSQGQLARDQLGAAVDEIVDVSKRRSEEFRAAVGAEVRRQLGLLGIAGKGETKPKKAKAKKAAAKATKAPAEPAAKKTTAKKATKAPVKKSAAKKATAKKATAKKATVRKASVKKASVKKATAKKAAKATKTAQGG
jgi:polyhydroxyalkanoate synthesis regulator phasin